MTSDEAINELQGGGLGSELGCPESMKPSTQGENGL